MATPLVAPPPKPFTVTLPALLNPQTDAPYKLTFDREPTPEEIDQVVSTIRAQRPESSFTQALSTATRTGVATLGEVVKQETLPGAIATLAPTVIAGPGAGLAVRAGLAGLGSLAGRIGTAGLRGQPAPGGLAQAAELAMGGLPEIPARALDPSAARQITTALSKEAGVRGGITAQAQASQVGRVLRRSVGDIRAQASRDIDRLYTKVDSLATSRGLAGDVSPLTTQRGQEVLAAIDELGLTTPEKLRMQTAVQRLSSGQPLPFTEMHSLWREVSDLGDAFAKTLGRGPRNPLNQLSASLKGDIRAVAAGTPVERALDTADSAYVNEFLPTIKAVKNIDSAAPEDVVNTLVTKPSALKRVLQRVDPKVAADMRSAWWADALEGAKDNAGLVDPRLLKSRIMDLKPASRRVLVEENASVKRLTENLEALVKRDDFAQQHSLLQTVLPATAGVGAVYATGNIALGTAALLTTVAGTRAMGRIMANPAARRLFAKGLARERRDARAAGRLLIQAGARAGVDFFAPEMRLQDAEPAAAQP